MIDPSSLLQSRPLQLPDPFQTAAHAFTIKDLLNRDAIAQYTLAQAKRRDAAADSYNAALPDLIRGDFSSGALADAVSRNPAAAPELLKATEDAAKRKDDKRKTDATVFKDQTATQLKMWSQMAGGLAEQVRQGKAPEAWVGNFFKKMSDEGVDKYLPALPFNAWNDRNAVADYLGTLGNAFYETSDRIKNQETGRHNLRTEDLTAQERAEQSRHNITSEGLTLRGQDRQSADNAASRGVQMSIAKMADARAREQHDQDRLSQPFEVTGPDGRQILAQQDKRSGVLYDVNSKQPLTGVAPKLSADTQNHLADVRQTSMALDQMIAGFKPEYVGWKGAAGEASDRYGSQLPLVGGAMGDPNRVAFRQKSAEVVNNYIKAITGATVGQNGEQQRLMRAVPEPDDSPLQFEAKMRQMRANLDALPAIIANNPNLRGGGGSSAVPTQGGRASGGKIGGVLEPLPDGTFRYGYN